MMDAGQSSARRYPMNRTLRLLAMTLSGLVPLLPITQSSGQPGCASPGCHPTVSNGVNNNTAGGSGALQNLDETITGGLQNTAFGSKPLFNNTTGSSNTAIGFNALLSNIIGDSNTAIGVNALA